MTFRFPDLPEREVDALLIQAPQLVLLSLVWSLVLLFTDVATAVFSISMQLDTTKRAQ